MNFWNESFQLLLSFFLGIIFASFSTSLGILIGFLLIYEAVYYSIFWKSWGMQYRVGIVFAYIAGWLIGHWLHDMDIAFVNHEHDLKCLGEQALCKRKQQTQ